MCKLCYPNKFLLVVQKKVKKIAQHRSLETFFKNLCAPRIFFFQEFSKILSYEKINIPFPEKNVLKKNFKNYLPPVSTNFFQKVLAPWIFRYKAFVKSFESEKNSG